MSIEKPGTAERDLSRASDDNKRTWASHGREEQSPDTDEIWSKAQDRRNKQNDAVGSRERKRWSVHRWDEVIQRYDSRRSLYFFSLCEYQA